MGFTLILVSAFTMILGTQLINIYSVSAANVDIYGLMETMDYEPPNQGGPDSSQGSGTR
ncbi:MAG: hypothetical protein WBV73_30815 [Phormidium sp.]